jgi:hypothetical protein
MELLEEMNEVLLNIVVCCTFEFLVKVTWSRWVLSLDLSGIYLACNISRPFYQFHRQDNVRRGSSWQFRE